MLREIVLAAALLVGCSGRGKSSLEHTEANGFNDPGLRLSICGAVDSFAPPSPTAEGTLALDAGWWVVAKAARLRGEEVLAPGADVCLAATLDTERRIVDADISVAPSEDPWARLPP